MYKVNNNDMALLFEKDHAGAALPPKKFVEELLKNLATNLRLGNPHSPHSLGQFTHLIISGIRERFVNNFI